MWKPATSYVCLLAALQPTAAFAVVRGLPSLQDLDAPYPAEDGYYFPHAGTHAWVNPNGTQVPKSCGSSKPPFPMPDCHGLTLEEATIDEMQGWMSSGLLTSRQLTKCYLGRILQLNEYVK